MYNRGHPSNHLFYMTAAKPFRLAGPKKLVPGTGAIRELDLHPQFDLRRGFRIVPTKCCRSSPLRQEARLEKCPAVRRPILRRPI